MRRQNFQEAKTEWGQAVRFLVADEQEAVLRDGEESGTLKMIGIDREIRVVKILGDDRLAGATRLDYLRLYVGPVGKNTVLWGVRPAGPPRRSQQRQSGAPRRSRTIIGPSGGCIPSGPGRARRR